MDTLNYILTKFELDTWQSEPLPITIPLEEKKGLARLFRELGFTVGAEVGVERGRFSLVLLIHNPKLTLYGVDPWITYDKYVDYQSQDQLDLFYRSTKDRLVKHNVFDRFRMIQEFSEEAVKNFEDGSLDFVYIDGNHDLLNVVRDLTLWTPKVRKGGLIVGHDYTSLCNAHNHVIHVMEGAQAFAKVYEIKPWFIFGTFKPGNGSFMWVKK